MIECPEQKVVEILKNNSIDIAATLPCDRIKVLLPLISRSIQTIQLTREETVTPGAAPAEVVAMEEPDSEGGGAEEQD